MWAEWATEQAANDDRSTGRLVGDAGIGAATEDPMTATMTRTENLAETDVLEPARRRWPGVAMALGLLLVLTAGGLVAAGRSGTVVVPDSALTPFPTVATATSTYQPGHTSGWHVHPGVHSVVVLSGTLTIYDENCVRTDYGPGQTYLGGATPHVARNETLDVLDVAITFVYRRAD